MRDLHHARSAEAPAPATTAKRPPSQVIDLESRLLSRARAGDVAAWSRLYQEHFDLIFRHIIHLSGDRDLAEDLVQETFAKAIVALPSFRAESKFSTWLCGIAINIVRGHWRRQESARRTRDGLGTLQEIAPPTGTNPDRQRLQKARAEVLYDILSDFPETLREVFILRSLEGLPAKEVAAQLGISEGNVNVRASRARARVRKELERRGWLSARGEAQS